MSKKWKKWWPPVGSAWKKYDCEIDNLVRKRNPDLVEWAQKASAEELLLELFEKWPGPSYEAGVKALEILADRANANDVVANVVELYFNEILYTKALGFPPLWPSVRKHSIKCLPYLRGNVE